MLNGSKPIEPATILHTLERHGLTLSVERGRLRVAPSSELTPELRQALRENRDDLVALLTVPRLPWQLERLLSAASSGLLTFTLRGVPNVNSYVTGWGCVYLMGDREEALERLWAVYRAWQPEGVN